MKKAKRKRPVVARKRKVTARRKPATPRKKKRKAKMSKKSHDDDNEDEPRTATKHPEPRRTAGDQPEQTSDPVELAKKQHGGIDPMGQPPDNPQAPNPPSEPQTK
jgi:hypothetical protein